MSKNRPSVPMTPADPGVTLELSIRDRIIFGSVFPDQGNLLEMKIIRAIEKKIEPSAEDLKSVNFTDVLDPQGRPTGRVKWDNKKEKPLMVSLSGLEIDLLKKFVNRMSGENKITRELADLAIKIEESRKGA